MDPGALQACRSTSRDGHNGPCGGCRTWLLFLVKAAGVWSPSETTLPLHCVTVATSSHNMGSLYLPRTAVSSQGGLRVRSRYRDGLGHVHGNAFQGWHEHRKRWRLKPRVPKKKGDIFLWVLRFKDADSSRICPHGWSRVVLAFVAAALASENNEMRKKAE